MAAGTEAKKQATILGLSEEIGRILGVFHATLDEHFYRSVTGVKECEKKPQDPNVLDEIIENLEADKNRLCEITSFIQQQVLPKIN